MFNVKNVLVKIAVCLTIVAGGCSSRHAATDSIVSQAPSKWEHRLLKQPGDSGEQGKIFVVKDGKRDWITHASWIGAHASEYPAGVETISAADLLSIPAGDPITDEK